MPSSTIHYTELQINTSVSYRRKAGVLRAKLTGSSGLRSTEMEHLWQKYFGGLAVVGA